MNVHSEMTEDMGFMDNQQWSMGLCVCRPNSCAGHIESGVFCTDTPILRGTAPPFAHITVFISDQELLTSADASGQWSVPAGPLPPATYQAFLYGNTDDQSFRSCATIQILPQTMVSIDAIDEGQPLSIISGTATPLSGILLRVESTEGGKPFP